MSNKNDDFLCQRSRLRVSLCAGLCALALLAAPTSSLASNGEVAKEAGIGFGAVLATLIYGPLKLAYATGGLTIGGLAWMFSGGDNDVARAIVIPSVAGDYVVTPSVLRGEDTLEFLGRDPNYRDGDDIRSSGVAAAPPDSDW